MEGGRGELSNVVFWKSEKSALIWGKIPRLWSSMGKIYHLKCNIYKFPGKKLVIFSLRGFSLLCCWWMFIKVHKFQENSPVLKSSGYASEFACIYYSISRKILVFSKYVKISFSLTSYLFVCPCSWIFFNKWMLF